MDAFLYKIQKTSEEPKNARESGSKMMLKYLVEV